MIKRVGLGITGLLFALIVCLTLSLSAAQLPVKRIGIVIDGPWERNDEIRSLFQKEILDLLQRDYDVRFPRDKLIVADWTVGRVKAALDRLLADPEVDLVIASGVLASNDVCRRGPLPKPVVAPFVLDPQVQGIPFQNGTSGVGNLSYITFPADIRYGLDAFLDVVSFKRFAFLHRTAIIEAIPELRQNVLNAVRDLNLIIDFVPVGDSIDAALDALPAGVEAVYVVPLLGLPPSEFEQLVSGLIERKLPSYSVVSTSEVKRGLLVGTAPDFNIPPLARRMAINIQRTFLGEDPSTFQVVFPRGERLTINMATARAIGVFPNWRVINEAELVDDEEREEVRRHLTLLGVAREAVEVNLDLAARERAVAAGAQEVKEARSALLPQVSISGLGVVIDKDLGSRLQAERTFTGAAGFSQVIFSERAHANFKIQGHLQKSREFERDQVRLDIAQQAATAYLHVLRGKTFERIQKENVKLSRSNLELAQVRQSIGFSGPGEVYRWESQVALDLNAGIRASSQRNLAEIALNRVLHRPLEEPFLMEETGLDNPHLITGHERFLPYVSNKWSFKVLRRFMVEEGLDLSPELSRLDAAIAAQERALHSSKRTFWSPTIAAQGELTDIFSRGGTGSGTPAPGGDFNWNVGVNISLPLFSGGARIAALQKAREELERLRLEREGAAERIEQRVRSAMHVMGASYAGIRLSREAAEAARKNLELTIDAYSRGAVSVLDLLDAQNAALVADLGAANAVYDFLLDLMETERAVGRFTFFMNASEVNDFFERLDAFYVRSGASTGSR